LPVIFAFLSLISIRPVIKKQDSRSRKKKEYPSQEGQFYISKDSWCKYERGDIPPVPKNKGNSDSHPGENLYYVIPDYPVGRNAGSGCGKDYVCGHI
jgi:hypothetical protein